jgi:hypothetical protein
MSAAAWFSAIISIGLPNSLLLEKGPQLKPIRECLAVVIIITLCSLSISGILGLILSRMHGTNFTLEFLAVALLLGLSISIQDLSQSINDKYRRYGQTFRTSIACALAPIPAFLIAYHTVNNTFESFLLLLAIIRISILLALEASLLHEALIAFVHILKNSDSRKIAHSCRSVIQNSFPYFIGRLATTSYSFASASIILTIFSPALTASYFLGVRVLSALLTAFSGFFQRYALVSLTETDAISPTVTEKLLKLIRFFRTFTWSFPCLVSVFAITFYGVSTAVPLGFTFSYQLVILIALVFATRLVSLIVGTFNTALLTKRYYLISSVGYYLLCYSLLVAIKSLNADFNLYMTALCSIELFLLAANLLGLAAYLNDSKICRALASPLTCFVAIFFGNAMANHM